MYNEKPLRDYLDDLAARRPAPGGGSAAALSAAIGAALISMVANYTVGNPKYKSDEDKVAVILKKAEAYRTRLLALVDEDVSAYEKLCDGIKNSPKGSQPPDGLYKDAITPPLEMCRISAEALGICKEIAECGNRNLITDTAIAAILLEGAFFSAKFNVYINLKYIKDIDFIGNIHKELSPLEKSLPELKEEILEMCEEVIK